MNGLARKARRQREIVELLRQRRIGSQDELARALAERGHAVTQSTLSRDLRELAVLRAPTDGGYRYLPAGDVPPPAGNARRAGLAGIAAAEVLRVDANESVAIIRTQVGRASGVAVYLDELGLPEVLATLAGDDTILIVPRTVAETPLLRQRLRTLFGLD